ncbi:MAG: LysM peptidoglycan-binding domain-containing protein, partial [Lachnospiraceae bacterium]|nr:LysM peptidoglycan-binding domain-containing protein [Lachnospiraceae bacterium]
EPVNIDLLMSMPGLTGIRIKEGDSLWSVAKENHTTFELIRQSNPNLEEPLKPGNVLLLVKQVE